MIWDTVFPPSLYCLCCGKYTDKSRAYSLCDHCIRHMNFEMTDLTLEEDKYSKADKGLIGGAAAAMGYGLYEKQIIFALKYSGHTYIARHMADILYDCLKKRLEETRVCPWLKADVIVPVPLSRSRMKERGFNQAEKIGYHLGKRTGIKTCGDGLIRVKDTVPQRALSGEERKLNVEHAFMLNPKRTAELKGKRILLIDDICTTGATALACAKALADGDVTRTDFIALSSAKNNNHLL